MTGTAGHAAAQAPGAATNPWALLPAALAGTPLAGWGAELVGLAQARMLPGLHGDLARWEATLAALPDTPCSASLDQTAPALGDPVAEPAQLREQLLQLQPWRKGPFRLGGVEIDSEWRSDLKWSRIERHLELKGQTVLDVGCGNGYFGWRMLGAGARCVVGVDPTLLFVMQWRAQAHFAGALPNFVLPLALEDLPAKLGGFDSVWSMGVLYHRRDPLAHLQRLHQLVRSSGHLVLETLVLDRQGLEGLVPAERYARMRNVWLVPTPGQVLALLREAGFREAVMIDLTPTSTSEQHSTPWMRFESLAEALDSEDPRRTVEGYPAPVRAAFLASVA